MTANEQMITWLEERGLDPELADKMGWDGALDRSGKAWVRIPYLRDGKRINRKYRLIGGKEFRNDPGSEHDLYNVDCLRDETLSGHPLLITEGEMDALACMQAGYHRVVSIPDGWSKTIEDIGDQAKADVFRRNEGLIKNAGMIVAAVDNDDTGYALQRAIANFFEDVDVYWVKWPDGCKDANDTLLMHGQEGITSAVSSARPMDPKGGLITGFSDAPPRAEQKMWKVGDRHIDNVVCFRTGEFSVLTGIPGSGKTTLVGWMCHKLVKEHDIRIGLGLFETSPAEVFDQLSRLDSGLPTASLSDDEHKAFGKKLDRNYRLFHRVDESKDGDVHGMAWLRSMIHKLAVRDGCNIVFIDPWNELEHFVQTNETMTQYINLALSNVRQWAEKFDIHICIVAHPRKMQLHEEPTGYHVADSAAFFNKPAMGWTVHNRTSKPQLDENGKELPPDPPYVTLRAWKVRNRQETRCRPGVVRMNFDETKMNYEPIERTEN
jgi:twinkle protein